MIVQKRSARFCAGDKVRVISYDPTDFTKQWWSTRVQKYKGYELTIREIGSDEHGFFYDVDECDITFDERWLEPIRLFSEESDEEFESLDLSMLLCDFYAGGGVG